MLKIYGIKNCDTMKKAFTWLDSKGIKYVFHNYKTDGIDENTILDWLKKLPLDQVINMKGATWRGLSEEEKASVIDINKAINLMIAKPSMIKRPLVQFNQKYILGFSEQEWLSLL